MRYVGVDLAWSDGRPSGVVVLDAQGRPEEAAYLVDLDAIAALCLSKTQPDGAVVAVDAPLQVPNPDGQREAERQMLKVFGSRHVGAHAVNRKRLVQLHGGIRGEELARRLAHRLAVGAPAAESGPASAPRSVLLEVYPHAAVVAWFDLPQPLAYKRGSLAARAQGLRELAQLLLGLAGADPPLELHQAPWLTGVLQGEPGGEEELAGPWLDQVESLLDAAICAHVGHFWHRWGAARCGVFGTPEKGQIVTPLPRELWAGPEAPRG